MASDGQLQTSARVAAAVRGPGGCADPDTPAGSAPEGCTVNLPRRARIETSSEATVKGTDALLPPTVGCWRAEPGGERSPLASGARWRAEPGTRGPADVPELEERVPGLPNWLRSDPETERYRLFDAARMLVTRRAPGDVDRALHLLDQARAAARELSLTNLESRSVAVLRTLG